MDDAADYNLTCWYLHQRRVLELTAKTAMAADIEPWTAIDGMENGSVRTHLLQARLKNNLVEWARAVQPPTLGQLLLEKRLTIGAVFTHYSNFYCRGLPLHLVRRAQGLPCGHLEPPAIHTKLRQPFPKCELWLQYDPADITSHSAGTILSGQHQLFVIGAVHSTAKGTIRAIPYVFATLLSGLSEAASPKAMRWPNMLEVYVDEIDSFSLVEREPVPSIHELEALRQLPEDAVRSAMADIIDERTIPKHWGGETSDLFSTRMRLDGNRTSSAWIFKGPAKFKPMVMADLGKAGDQIHRLFSEPAELLVLQHCHEISPAVRGAMRAYATTIGNPRQFVLIDGFDTLRILRAYSKCGFTPTGSE